MTPTVDMIFRVYSVLAQQLVPFRCDRTFSFRASNDACCRFCCHLPWRRSSPASYGYLSTRRAGFPLNPVVSLKLLDGAETSGQKPYWRSFFNP